MSMSVAHFLIFSLDNKFKSIYAYCNSNRKGEIMMTQPMNTMGLAYVNYDWSYFYGFGFLHTRYVLSHMVFSDRIVSF